MRIRNAIATHLKLANAVMPSVPVASNTVTGRLNRTSLVRRTSGGLAGGSPAARSWATGPFQSAWLDPNGQGSGGVSGLIFRCLDHTVYVFRPL
jgi:hypothetical protein